ncbi:MAG: DUF3084 domain-containing protein [Candidatus Eremiobacterota bacterium]
MGTILRVFFIYLVVAVLSGGIAYLGNQLGRHIGRRKMSVFGMRPRHTSIFITTLTGVLIALGTLSVAALSSLSVRHMLIGIQQLEEREKELTAKVERLQEDLERGSVMLGVNQSIEIATVQCGLPAPRIEEQLQWILSSANSEAVRDFNRKALEKGVALIDPETLMIDVDPSEVRRLARSLSEQEGMSGVWVRVSRNYRSGGGRLAVRLDSRPVELAFREGEVVASRTVDPHSPSLLMDWYQFVEEIKQSARTRKMVELPNERGLGVEIDLNSLIARIEEHRGPTRLVAVARRDLYETNRLDVEIQVHPAEPQAGPSGQRPRTLAGGGRP